MEGTVATASAASSDVAVEPLGFVPRLVPFAQDRSPLPLP